MKKKVLLWVLAVVLVLASVQSALGDTADLNNASSYWTFDDDDLSSGNPLDIIGSVDGTNNGASTGQTGLIKESFEFDGSSDYVDLGSNYDLTDSFTLNVWINEDGGTGNNNKIIGAKSNWDLATRWNADFGKARIIVRDSSDTAHSLLTTSALPLNEWVMLTVTYNKSAGVGKIYVNGELNNTDNTFPTTRKSGGQNCIGQNCPDSNSYFDGNIDEVSVYDGTVLSASDIETLYNNGNGEQYPYTTSNVSVSLSTTGISPAVPESDDVLTDNATVTTSNGVASNVTAEWNLNGVLSETDTFNGVANGSTVSASFDCNANGCGNGDNVTVVWNATNPNASTETTDGPVQVQDKGFIKIENVTEKITGNSIDTFNLTSPVNASTTNGTLTVEVDIGTQNFTIDASDSGYLNTKTVEATVNFSQTTTINASGFFNVNATLQVNASDGTDVNNYDVVANTTDFNGGIRYAEQKTASGSDVTFQLIAGNWTFNIENATQSGTNYSTATRKIKLNETTTPTLNFTVYLSNSFDLEIRDEQTDTLIDDRNVTLEFISDLEASNYTTSNGTLFVDAFMPAEIEIRYDASGYDERSYYKFLTNQSYNNITLYLLNSSESNTIIVDVIDESGAEVEGVVLQILRGFINGNKQEYKIVEMDKTDFAGEAVIRAELNDPDYKIKVVEDVETNENLFLSDPFEITNTLLEVTVNLLGDPLEGYTRWRDISFDEPVYDNSSKQWNASYTDNAGLINPGGEVCLIVKKSVGVEWQDVGETCSSATSADLTVNYDDPDHGSIAFLIADTNTENSKHVLSSVQTLVGTRNRLAQALGGTGAFLTAGVVYTVGAIFLFNPTTYIVGIILASFASFAIGLLNLTWGAGLSFILIVGMFIALRMRT